jgi:AP-4 complex subunit epsilon-1
MWSTRNELIGNGVTCLFPTSAVVRKRAVVALRAFQLKDPNSVSHLGGEVRATMCDKDPSVMYASLSVLYPMMKAEPLDFKGFVGSLVNILNQILEHRLRREYDYHRIPAPWLQIQLLKMLRFLGEDDEGFVFVQLLLFVVVVVVALGM